MKTGRLFTAGAVLMALAVAFGAFGAHALKGRLSLDQQHWYELATRYMVWHALPLLVIDQLGPRARRGGYFLLAGVVIFCGSLFAMAFGGPRMLGAITPIGGLSFIIGWIWIAVTAGRPRAT